MTSNDGQAHFQLFVNDTRLNVRWRLLSGNNRELGRSVDGYVDSESCLLAVKEFVESIDDLVPQVRRRDRSGWGWVLLAEDGPVVMCGHPYDRQVRCAQALQNFLGLARSARVGDGAMVSRSRRWSHPTHGRQPIHLNSGTRQRSPRQPT
jgi:hypothetical protein